MLLCKNIIYHYSDCTFSKLRNSVLWIPVDPKIFSIPFLNQQVKYFKNCRQFPSYSPSRIPTRILPRHFPKSRENPKNNPRETEKSRASSQGSLQFSFEFAVFSFCSRRCRSRKSKSPSLTSYLPMPQLPPLSVSGMARQASERDDDRAAAANGRRAAAKCQFEQWPEGSCVSCVP